MELKTQANRDWFNKFGRQVHMNHIGQLEMMADPAYRHPQRSEASALLASAKKRLADLDAEMTAASKLVITAFDALA